MPVNIFDVTFCLVKSAEFPGVGKPPDSFLVVSIIEYPWADAKVYTPLLHLEEQSAEKRSLPKSRILPLLRAAELLELESY
jgi:hypothetical protein